MREVGPEAVVSVDTFRADVARRCVEAYGVEIVNDISGGEMDPEMFATVAALGTPNNLMHMKGTPQTMQQAPSYDALLPEMIAYFSERIERLRLLGQKDIIIATGFGFAKTLEHNYELMGQLEALQCFGLPILSGISRKSMIYRLLGTSPAEALNGTTVLNTLSLIKGASILRVHDVRECVEVCEIVKRCFGNT